MRSHGAQIHTASGVLLAIKETHTFRNISSKRQSASPLELTDRRNMMRKESLHHLYIDELKDLYSAETQIVKALPKMAKASSNAELRQGFEEHLRQTSEHVSRLEQIFEMLGEKATGKKCLGMEGLIKEGSETMQESYADALMDAALIGAAQRVEHYEIAGYGTVRAFADLLGESEHVSLIDQTLQEEKQTDDKLTQLAERINSEASQTVEETQSRQMSKQSKGASRRAA
jgi:ferritin-like metal-binding protein YciE